MSMAISRTNIRLAAILNNLRSRYVSLRAAIAEEMARRARYRRSVIELTALSGRDLSDIGISRADIPRIAFEESQRDRANETV